MKPPWMRNPARFIRSMLPIVGMFALQFISCDESNSNQAPVIQSVSASPVHVTAGGLTTLTCVASDQDGGPLLYSWSCPQGTFPEGASQPTVTWRAPTVLGTFLVSVMVSDGMALDTSSVSVSVLLSTNTPPNGAFTITPGSGTTATVFQMDASGSSDAQTPSNQLEVRWDWTNDGAFDTNWSVTKTASHQFPSNGDYWIRLQVRDGDGMTGGMTRSVSIGTTNTAPSAQFTVSPESGTPSTFFQMDASGSSDAQTPTPLLQVRWDWTDDGVFDTSWSTEKSASHRYGGSGIYSIRMQVKDTDGLTDETTRTVSVSSGGGQLLQLVSIPAGSFTMGQIGVANPEHSVNLTHGFMLGQTEVTNAQYLSVLNWALDQGLVSVDGDFVKQNGMDLVRINQAGFDWHEIRYDAGLQQFFLNPGTHDAGTYGPGDAFPHSYDPANHPVKHVTWYGAACFCDWRSMMDGLTPYYNGNWSTIPVPNNPYEATGYRLPTEAEWEYAAQYFDERTYPWGNTEPSCTHANFFDGDYCAGWTNDVAMRPAGASLLGLQDMAGNVTEWCNDWYTSYASSSQTNPVGPPSGTNRVLRGGSWISFGADYVKCAVRDYDRPENMATHFIGFRLCRTTP